MQRLVFLPGEDLSYVSAVLFFFSYSVMALHQQIPQTRPAVSPGDPNIVESVLFTNYKMSNLRTHAFCMN